MDTILHFLKVNKTPEFLSEDIRTILRESEQKNDSICQLWIGKLSQRLQTLQLEGLTETERKYIEGLKCLLIYFKSQPSSSLSKYVRNMISSDNARADESFLISSPINQKAILDWKKFRREIILGGLNLEILSSYCLLYIGEEMAKLYDSHLLPERDRFELSAAYIKKASKSVHESYFSKLSIEDFKTNYSDRFCIFNNPEVI
jgi:hypothetical protein